MEPNVVKKRNAADPSVQKCSTKEPDYEKTNISNSAEIKKFFQWFGDDTHSEYAKFILDMFTSFLNHEREEDCSYTREYKDKIFFMTSMLNDFIQSLKVPKG